VLKLRSWNELLGQTIEQAIRLPEGYLALTFKGGYIVSFHSRLLMSGLDFYPDPPDASWTNFIDPTQLSGKRIASISVPFIADDARDFGEVRFRFFDGSSLLLASQDRYEPVEISFPPELGV